MLNMHGDLRRDSSSDCLGGVLDARSDNPLPDLIPPPFAQIPRTPGGGEPVDFADHQLQTMKDDLCIGKRRVYLRAGWNLQNARKLPGIPARSGQRASLNFTGSFDACGAVSFISEPFR
jgi:hypothetical protein